MARPSREAMQPNDQFMIDWFLRTIEIIDKYEPQVLWFDWWIEQPAFEPWLRKIAAYYYNRAHTWGRGVVLQYKYDAFKPGTAIFDIERGALDGIHPTVWQNDTSVSRNSWSYIEGHDYKSAAEIIAELVDVVSKNGVLLLNIGPKADGTIAEPEQELLRTHRALARACTARRSTAPGPGRSPPRDPPSNAAATSPTHPPRSYTSQDIRFTYRNGVEGEFIYATALDWPADGTLLITSLGRGAGLGVGTHRRCGGAGTYRRGRVVAGVGRAARRAADEAAERVRGDGPNPCCSYDAGRTSGRLPSLSTAGSLNGPATGRPTPVRSRCGGAVDDDVVRPVGTGQTIVERRHSPDSKIVERHPNGGQRWPRVVGGPSVVDADHREVLGDPIPEMASMGQHSQGGIHIGDEQGTRRVPSAHDPIDGRGCTAHGDSRDE